MLSAGAVYHELHRRVGWCRCRRVRCVLARACQGALGSWQAAIAEAIRERGAATADARRLATLVLAGIEGGLLLARAQRDSGPLRAVGDELAAILRRRIPDASRP